MATDTLDRRLVTILFVVLAALVLVPLLFTGFGMMSGWPVMGSARGGGMWGPGGTAPGWALLVGVVMQVLFLAAVVGVGYLVYRAVTRPDDTAGRALEELRLAYARGDLSDEEYEQRRDALERDS